MDNIWYEFGSNFQIFSILSIISLSLMFMMTTWITIVYGCGSRSELDLTSPLQNFSRKIFPSYYDLGSATPFRLNSHGGIDLDYAWKFLVASYIVSTISMLFIIPQFFGAVHLLKATEADTPFELANWHANRYLFTQRVVMAVEFVGMMMIGATCLIWPILLQFNVTFMAYISLLFIVCCRYKANGFVEKFIRALAREAVQPQMNGRWMQLL